MSLCLAHRTARLMSNAVGVALATKDRGCVLVRMDLQEKHVSSNVPKSATITDDALPKRRTAHFATASQDSVVYLAKSLSGAQTIVQIMVSVYAEVAGAFLVSVEKTAVLNLLVAQANALSVVIVVMANVIVTPVSKASTVTRRHHAQRTAVVMESA